MEDACDTISTTLNKMASRPFTALNVGGSIPNVKFQRTASSCVTQKQTLFYGLIWLELVEFIKNSPASTKLRRDAQKWVRLVVF
jgi:hypothetical protein